MESNVLSPSPDNTETKAAFKKPSNDAGNRHYRRRSPVGGSSSSEGSEDNRRDRGSMRRKDGEIELDKDSGRTHQSRSGDTYRDPDRKSSKSSYSNHRRDTYDKHGKINDAEGRHHSRPFSRSGHGREDNDHHKSRQYSYRDDKYSRDKTKDIDERREYRRGDNKYSRSPVHGSSLLRDKDVRRSSDRKDLYGQKYDKEDKRKLIDRETSKQMDRSDRQPREQSKERRENENSPAKKQKPVSLGNEERPSSGCTAADIDAAKKTALKAAESVNKNLMGTGYMSADQKKKLLWGNKKSTPAEESTHRWDTATFSDREQQEKFNKLMSLRFRWYIWPIVGCESRSKSGSKPQQSREAKRNAARLGEAICRWASSERWSHCWAWSVIIATSLGWLSSCKLTYNLIYSHKTMSFQVIEFLFPRDKHAMLFSSYLLEFGETFQLGCMFDVIFRCSVSFAICLSF